MRGRQRLAQYAADVVGVQSGCTHYRVASRVDAYITGRVARETRSRTRVGRGRTRVDE
jgi:hypothetical protein